MANGKGSIMCCYCAHATWGPDYRCELHNANLPVRSAGPSVLRCWRRKCAYVSPFRFAKIVAEAQTNCTFPTRTKWTDASILALKCRRQVRPQVPTGGQGVPSRRSGVREAINVALSISAGCPLYRACYSRCFLSSSRRSSLRMSGGSASRNSWSSAWDCWDCCCCCGGC